MPEEKNEFRKDETVSYYRKLKRNLRKKIDWNNLKLKIQLRTHLIWLFVSLFATYFVVIFIYTRYAYVAQLAHSVGRNEFNKIL